MKRLLTAALLLLASYAAALAANTKEDVTQVTQDITLTEDVDFHITSDEPFTMTGSIDIVNTEHAVVIFDALRPSKAKSYLSFIKINGEEAKDGTNCQLKLYNRGAIILPYGGTSFRPLTVFDGEAFTGESYSTLTEGHASGYMKDMPTAWNNRIKSFKLKRGYMVTFALKKSGRGYSRCFIAANSDLEVDLTKESNGLMSGRISSYRIFKWYDAGKKQLANAAGDKTSLDLLNVQSTYDWGQGNTSLQPDYEWVPNHIYEDWPSSSTIGSTSQSPHTKTNNEPKNQSDDHPQDLETILGNWENMMRTGLRLCSPASWDGSDYWNATGFLADFLDEVDKRGWRCDIIDLHCYWPEGNFGNVSNWSNKYKRPIWISEWCWGASWNNNGSFSGNATEASFANAIRNITTNLNNNAAVERYYYWNGENGAFPCKLTRNGALTQAGQYYSDMDSGLAYTGYGNYIPKAPTPGTISDLSSSNFNVRTKVLTLKWTNVNGELTTGAALQRKIDGGSWETIYTYKGGEKENESSITFTDNIEPGGKYSYRLLDTVFTKAIKSSNTYDFYTNQATGTATVKHGTITSMPAQQAYTFFNEPYFEEAPVIVTGSATYKNAASTALPNGVVNNPLLLSKGTSNLYENFSYQEKPWNYLKNDVYTVTTPTKEETTNFIAVAAGNGQIGDLHYEAGNITGVKNTVVEVTFTQPFEEAPVVMVTPIHNTPSLPVMTWRIYDVTKEGFKLQLMHQKGETVKTFTARKVGYLAIEKGTGSDGLGALYTVGSAEATFKTVAIAIPYGDEISLTDPKAMVQLQTYNHQAAAILRIPSLSATGVSVRMQVDPTDPDMVLNNTRSATEEVGYIIISADPDFDGINTVQDSGFKVQDSRIFDLSGRRLQNSQLRQGVYIINGRKVMVK